MTQRRTEYQGVVDLFLDPSNYRLPKDTKLDSQVALAQYLEDHYDLEEIGVSMAIEGFRPEEPLLVVSENDRLIVVEGNRRLATVRLLTDADYRAGLSTVQRQAKWDALATETATQMAVKGWDLAEVPIVMYDVRSQLEGSLGFRHVSGIVQWSAESKARYIADLVDKGHDYQSVSRMIGSKSDYVQHQYVAHRALREADQSDVETTKAERFFGVYYRSLSSPTNRDFIGLIDWSKFDPKSESVFRDGVNNYDIYLKLIFGSETEDLAPVITDSRQLNDLARVLADDQARELLLAERDLAASLELLGGDRATVYSDMRVALNRLRRANGAAWEFEGDEELHELARKCSETAERLLDQLSLAEATE